MNTNLEISSEQQKPRTQRYSPHRLLRKEIVLPGNTIVRAEKHKGRIVVRFETNDSGLSQ